MNVSEILIRVRKYSHSYFDEKKDYCAKFARDISQIHPEIDPVELASALFDYDPTTRDDELERQIPRFDKFVAEMPRLLSPSELLAQFDVPDILLEVCDCEADGIPYVRMIHQSKLEFPVPPAFQHVRGEVRATFDDAVMLYTATIHMVVSAVKFGIAEMIFESQSEELERLVAVYKLCGFPEDTARVMARRKVLENTQVDESHASALLRDIASKFFSETGSLAKASPSERELIRMHLDDIFV